MARDVTDIPPEQAQCGRSTALRLQPMRRDSWHDDLAAHRARSAGFGSRSGDPTRTRFSSGSVSLASRIPHGQSSAAVPAGMMLSTSSTYRYTWVTGPPSRRCSDRCNCAGPRRSRTYSGQPGPKACSDSTSNPSWTYHSLLARASPLPPPLGHRSERAHRLPVQPGSAFLDLDHGAAPCCDVMVSVHFVTMPS